MVEVNLIVAFFGGILAFLSPCVLPLIPAFLAYMTGTTVSEVQDDKEKRMKIFLNTVFFVLGFSVVFALIGVLLGGILLGLGHGIRVWLGRIGGIVIIFFGLYLLGLVKMPLLDREYRVHAQKTKYHYLTSFIFGATFAAGWTPCVGVFLGTILTLAVTQPLIAFPLLLSFSLGLTFPFLVVGIFYSRASVWISKAGVFLKYFKIVSGIILIILGIFVFTNNLGLLANFGPVVGWLENLGMT